MPPELLEAILAAPDNDMPRLIAGDWFEENGEPERAEFIRVQIELAHRKFETPSLRDRTRLALETREKILLHKHGEQWLTPFRQRGEPLQSRGTHGQFVRGFVEVVWMSAAIFLKRGEKLLARTPLRELKVTRMSMEELLTLSHHSACEKLVSLDLSGRNLSLLAPFADCVWGKSFVALKRLLVVNCNLSDPGAEAIRIYPWAAPLERLDLSGNHLSQQAIDMLVGHFGDAVHF